MNTRHDTIRKPQSIMKQENTRPQRIMHTSPEVTTNTRRTMPGKQRKRMSKITAHPKQRLLSSLGGTPPTPPYIPTPPQGKGVQFLRTKVRDGSTVFPDNSLRIDNNPLRTCHGNLGSTLQGAARVCS